MATSISSQRASRPAATSPPVTPSSTNSSFRNCCKRRRNGRCSRAWQWGHTPGERELPSYKVIIILGIFGEHCGETMRLNSSLISTQISRRAMLGTAAAMAVTPASAEMCPIGPPAHDKGSRVWMDMDQVELDAAYDQTAYAPLIGQILKRYATSSNETRAHLGAPKRFAYGSTPVEGLDVYPAKTPNAPIFVFIHGGAWLRGEAKDYGCPAELFVDAGVNYIALG